MFLRFKKKKIKPEELTDIMVSTIGLDYLKKPQFFRTRYNNAAAAILSECDTYSNIQILSSNVPHCDKKQPWELRWELLLYVYSTLKEPTGFIAERIDNIFMEAYGKLPQKFQEISVANQDGVITEKYTTEQYVDMLRQIVAAYSPVHTLELKSK